MYFVKMPYTLMTQVLVGGTGAGSPFKMGGAAELLC